MSVIIKGMEMPNNCFLCPLSVLVGERLVCEVTRDEVLRWKIDFNCPLVELPPHGRLIDADELVADIKGQAERLWTLDSVSERDYFIERNEKFRQAMFKAWCESLFAYLDTRPTVIEREVAE